MLQYYMDQLKRDIYQLKRSQREEPDNIFDSAKELYSHQKEMEEKNNILDIIKVLYSEQKEIEKKSDCIYENIKGLLLQQKEIEVKNYNIFENIKELFYQQIEIQEKTHNISINIKKLDSQSLGMEEKCNHLHMNVKDLLSQQNRMEEKNDNIFENVKILQSQQKEIEERGHEIIENINKLHYQKIEIEKKSDNILDNIKGLFSQHENIEGESKEFGRKYIYTKLEEFQQLFDDQENAKNIWEKKNLQIQKENKEKIDILATNIHDLQSQQKSLNEFVKGIEKNCKIKSDKVVETNKRYQEDLKSLQIKTNELEEKDKKMMENLLYLVKYVKNFSIDNEESVKSSLNRDLYECSKVGNLGIIQVTIALGADINKEYGPFKQTPLLVTIGRGHESAMIELIKHGASIENKNNNGWTALHEASYYPNVSIVNELIKQGADLESKTEQPINWTPLMLASSEGRYAVVVELIKHGASIDFRNNDGKTALDLAIQQNHIEVIKILEKYTS